MITTRMGWGRLGFGVDWIASHSEAEGNQPNIFCLGTDPALERTLQTTSNYHIVPFKHHAHTRPHLLPYLLRVTLARQSNNWNNINSLHHSFVFGLKPNPPFLFHRLQYHVALKLPPSPSRNRKQYRTALLKSKRPPGTFIIPS